MQWPIRRKFQNLIEKGNAWWLAPLSFLWALVVHLRNFFYDLKTPYRVQAVVVSVGNVEVGGMGKTPLALHLAEQFPHRKVAILTRGYGKIADEAILLARRFPQGKVYVGKDRLSLAKEAQEDLLILDDGLQYRKLHRDFDLVLITEKKEHYLPWGRLRDSPKRLKGAQVISHQFCLKRILNGEGRELGSLEGKKIAFFCGIARPERFRKTLIDLGALIVAQEILADHELIDPNDLDKLVKSAEWVITTEKDFVKLLNPSPAIYYLEMDIKIRSDPSEWETLIEKINQKIDSRRGRG